MGIKGSKQAIVRAAEDGPARTVYESGNQADRAKLTQSSKCSHAETELFYTALQVFGLCEFPEKPYSPAGKEQTPIKMVRQSRLSAIWKGAKPHK